MTFWDVVSAIDSIADGLRSAEDALSDFQTAIFRAWPSIPEGASSGRTLDELLVELQRLVREEPATATTMVCTPAAEALQELVKRISEI